MGSEIDAERIRELDAEKAGGLEGIWVPSGIVERLSLPPTPLTLDLVLDDTLLLSEALDQRGESLPRLSRQLVPDRTGYEAWARELEPWLERLVEG